jgi:hypothetical protein
MRGAAMLLVESACYAAVMQKWFKACKALGRTYTETKEEYFGFEAVDVAGVHFSKGKAAGVYFRLHDGRVFDTAAQEHHPDPDLYDQTMH